MYDTDVFKSNKDIDNLLHRISFICVSHLMSKDVSKEHYAIAGNLSKESKQLAVELKILTSRVLSLAFNEKKFGVSGEDECQNKF
jgi:hypothetical protein